MSETYLSSSNIDDLGRMVMALVGELWITRDRVALLEHLLVDRNVLNAGELDNLIPNPDLSRELEAARDRLVASVLGAPVAAKERDVSSIIERAGMAMPSDTKL